MNRVKLAILLMAAPLVLAQAPAPDNPVTAHYHAYRVALGANDLATAETEAAAALDASVTRDGQGGVTAVLAMNLAQLRLRRGETAAAYAPAQQAFNISSSNPQAGVDPLLARLVLGRAGLSDGHSGEATNALPAAIHEAASRPDLNPDAYQAATELGQWFVTHNDFRDAVDAWTTAGDLANAAPGDHRYILAVAKVGEGVSRFMNASIREHIETNQPLQTHIRVTHMDDYMAADAAFETAEEELQDAAHVPAPNAAVTLAQSSYASALAWRQVLRAYLTTSDHVPADSHASREMVGVLNGGGGSSICTIVIHSDPPAQFPPGARTAQTVGAVAIRMQFNEQGERTDARVLASVPGAWFEESVARVLQQWSASPAPGSPPGCRPAPILFYSYYFFFR